MTPDQRAALPEAYYRRMKRAFDFAWARLKDKWPDARFTNNAAVFRDVLIDNVITPTVTRAKSPLLHRRMSTAALDRYIDEMKAKEAASAN